MKVLLVTWGTEGDTRPVLALARGLLAAGHDALVIADRNGADLAQAVGVPFEAMPGDFRALMAGDSATGEMVRNGQSPARIWPELVRSFARPALRLVLDRLDGVDVLVGSSMCKVPCEVIARRRGIPTVGIDLQPFTPTREFPPPLLDLTTLPRAANLPLYGAMNLAFAVVRRAFLAPLVPRTARRPAPPVPQVGAWSPTLVPRPREWPSDKPVVVGELQLDTAPEPLDDRLRDFVAAGEPPVYVGLGSMAGVDMTRFRRTVVGALDGRRAVLAAGWNDIDPEGLGDNVLAVERAPLGWLFPRCRVLVHHAGAGTAHLAARSGRPSVCVPQMADQSFWAQQFRRLGIAPDPVARDSVTVDGLRRALDGAQRLEGRCEVIARAMQADDGVTATCRIVEGMAR